MKKLTKIFSINYRINSIIEINKSINGINEYIIINKNEIVANNGTILVSDKFFTAHKDFFTTVHSV